MEQQKEGTVQEGNSSSLPPPGTEPWPTASFPGLPPALLGTPNPAHLGLPENLASVTVPIRLDALSSLLHSALLGAYALPACPCAPPCHPPQPGPAGSAPQARGRWDRQPRPGRGPRQQPWGSGRAEQPERGHRGYPGSRPRTPPTPSQTSPTQEGKKEPGQPEAAPDTAPVEEDWEAEY
ncbi:uncharacterized protein C19orf84 homolog [Sorex fumeus]|uniref:uncharacterized protein C19orf84 homolog n=1 Tax=Sorex fumeus TaxID=62283 RepID=UPI0024AC8E3D|nr:uncharacterized protein C19orf84 homolog [Sorex fumeus]